MPFVAKFLYILATPHHNFSGQFSQLLEMLRRGFEVLSMPAEKNPELSNFQIVIYLFFFSWHSELSMPEKPMTVRCHLN